MRDYEVVYIFRSALEEEAIQAKLERYHGTLSGGNGGGDGGVSAVEHWGKRQLAYPIHKETNGYYVVAQFSADPSVLTELERLLKLDDDLLRHLIVLSEGELPTPPHLREEEGEEDEDEGDEDEED